MKSIIQSPEAPQAVGPYSQGISAGNFIFLAGQIPLDPKTGELGGSTVAEQTQQILKNIQALLKAADASLDHVVKSTVFMTDLNDFAKMNEIYGSYFSKNPPARSTVQVAALPKGALVEIEVVAYID